MIGGIDMAKFITQTEYVNNVATVFEEKLATQYSRILQSAPTPVTYYHINNIESTTDSGFLNIENYNWQFNMMRIRSNGTNNYKYSELMILEIDLYQLLVKKKLKNLLFL